MLKLVFLADNECKGIFVETIKNPYGLSFNPPQYFLETDYPYENLKQATYLILKEFGQQIPKKLKVVITDET